MSFPKSPSFFFELFLLVACCGCASRAFKSPQDFLSEHLNTPVQLGTTETISRYWSFGHDLVHFVTNATETNRNSTPFLFVHGLGGTIADYSEIISLVRNSAQHPYYAVDLPPFGKSAMGEADLSIHHYAEMLAEFAEKITSSKIILVCHSLGGQICIDFALSNPSKIQLLTLVSPAGVYQKDAYINETLQNYVGITVGPVTHPVARSVSDLTWYDQEFTRRMITDNPLVLIAIESYRNNLRERVKDLQTKTVIVWGRQDRVFSVENAFFLKENIANSFLYVIDDADHFPLKTHAAFITGLIQKYL